MERLHWVSFKLSKQTRTSVFLPLHFPVTYRKNVFSRDVEEDGKSREALEQVSGAQSVVWR
jgi:hypothetical protein